MNFIAIFKDTINRINDEPDLVNAVDKSVKQSQIYKDYDEICLLSDITEKRKGDINVVPNTSFDAARMLKEKLGNKKRVTVLNFANAFHPGGGVELGARAQEECLCRCSTLFPVLNAICKQGKYYQTHYKQRQVDKDKLDQEGIIYSKDIIIIKTDAYEKLDEIVKVDVITSAAPELYKFPNINKNMVYRVYVNKIAAILKTAINNNCDAIVLGAFGCGMFANPPELVASAFSDVLNLKINEELKYKDCFEEIVFAIRAKGQSEKENYYKFKLILK